ncbi:unnamed protein product, partial [marine sediment metagenome]
GEKSFFALLFVALLVWVLRMNKEREAKMDKNNKEREEKYIQREEKYIQREIKYQTLVERLSQIIKGELCDIKEKVNDIIKGGG